jgi:hypothetical protein
MCVPSTKPFRELLLLAFFSAAGFSLLSAAFSFSFSLSFFDSTSANTAAGSCICCLKLFRNVTARPERRTEGVGGEDQIKKKKKLKKKKSYPALRLEALA